MRPTIEQRRIWGTKGGKTFWHSHKAACPPVQSLISRHPIPAVTNGAAKVSESYVRDIRCAHERGKSIKELCAHFCSLKPAAIRCIILRQSWKHVR